MAKAKILVIDDEPMVIKSVETVLKAGQYKIISAPDGETGIKKAKTNKPDLILLDIKMPGMDGYAVLKKLKEDKATQAIPVAMFTVKREIEDVVESIVRCGAVEYISKPFDSEELLEKIKKILGENV
jgi:DNA-binding response OmpR family regulator